MNGRLKSGMAPTGGPLRAKSSLDTNLIRYPASAPYEKIE
jgi:hypothetical protein